MCKFLVHYTFPHTGGEPLSCSLLALCIVGEQLGN